MWITTKTGKRINTDWFDKERQIQANKDEADSRNRSSVSKAQRDYEEKIRHSKTEKGAYFDKDGNLLMEGEGDDQQVSFGGLGDDDWDRTIKFNREIEQRIWRDEEVHFTHNHPENTIFSPEDVETFETLEAASESAVLPDGTTYRLIREQPRTSNVWIQNKQTGELEREFEPKKIAPAYDEAYSALFVDAFNEIRSKYAWGSPDRKKAEAALDRKVATEMERWLRKNAQSFGYRFERS